MTRVIGVISGKGGVGKTTLVSNVSVILSQKFNKDVTVVDCNLTTAHLSFYMGLFFSPITLNHVLKGETTIEEAIYEHSTGVKVIPASLSLAALEGVDISNLRETIKSLLGKTDIILLDASPGLGREATSAIRASDEVIFVTTPFLPCISDIIRSKNVTEEFGVKPLGIVLNMVTRDRNELRREEIEKLTSLPVIASIPYDKNVKRSLSLSVPVYLLKSNAKASKALVRFSASLIGEEYEESRFSRIFNKLRFW